MGIAFVPVEQEQKKKPHLYEALRDEINKLTHGKAVYVRQSQPLALPAAERDLVAQIGRKTALELRSQEEKIEELKCVRAAARQTVYSMDIYHV